MIFSTSVAHSIHLKDEFIKSGVKAEHIDGATPKPERDEILAKLSRGDIEVVVNCAVLVEGWDFAGRGLLRSRSTNKEHRPLSADGRPRVATVTRQDRRPDP